MAYTKLGRVRSVYKGAWSSAMAYTALEMVRSTDGRAAYIALKDVPAGTALTNTAYWGVVLDVSDVLEAADEAVSEAVARADTAADNANIAADFAPKPMTLTETAQPVQIWPEPGALLRPVVHIDREVSQSGSGDPSPDNIRPISGCTSVSFSKCRKNLIDMAAMTPRGSIVQVEHGENTIRVYTTTAASILCAQTDGFWIRAGTAYTLSAKVLAHASGTLRVGLRRKVSSDGGIINSFVSGAYITDFSASRATITFTPIIDEFVYLAAMVTWGAELGDATFGDIQLEAGSAATEYEPFYCETHALDFGDMYFAGSVNFYDGVLTADGHRCISLTGDEAVTAKTGGDGLTYYQISKLLEPAPSTGPYSMICSHYKPVGGVYSGSAEGIRLADDYSTLMLRDARFQDVADVEGVKAYFAAQAKDGVPIQICYELAAPMTVQLAPTEIPALDGLNTVFSDGEGLEVTYNKSLSREHAEIMAKLADRTYTAPVQSAWEQRMLDRIDQTMIPMPALRRMPKAPSGYISKGAMLTGINYSSVAGETYGYALVGPQTSLSTYYSALENPASVMYTEDLYQDDDRRSTHYGMVCSAFVSFAFGLSSYHTTAMLAEKYAGYQLDITDQSTEDDLFQIRRGDLLLNTLVTNGDSNHARIVRDVLYDRATGRLVGFNVVESWKPFVSVSFMTPGEFLAQMSEAQPYRVARPPEGDISLEVTPIKYSRSVYPDMGDGGRYAVGATISLYIPDAAATSVSVDGTSYALSALETKAVNDVTIYILSTTSQLAAGSHIIATNTAPDDPCTIIITE